MATNVKFLIFAHGNIIYGEEGASYDREPLRKIRVKKDASYEDLLNTICTKIEIDTSAHQIKVFHRHPEFVGGRVHYKLVPILDNDDVEDLIEMAQKMGEGSIQALYLEISNVSLVLSPNATCGMEDGNQTSTTSEASNPPLGKNHEEFLTNTKGGDGSQTSRAHSSTTPPPGQNYDVFLSFRGEDTRLSFTDHLYKGLVNVGVWAFRDNEELRVGEEIGPELLKAIKGSKISIPIISKNYASSRWCLMELVQILECMKTSGQIVLPIFYRVKPSEVGKQTGDFGNGFFQCKKKHGVEGRLVQEWKNALTEVTTLKGWESNKIKNGHEAELLQKVVNEVQEVLGKKTLRVGAYLVGVESHVEKITEQMKNAEGSGGVLAIVVHGMGGIGKTTLAKVVYNQLYSHFEGCSFIADIREASQHNGIKKLQEQLISNISGQRKDVHNVDEGADTIKARCERRKVLILLDDVDHRNQLNALAGEPNWFGRGSIIIITSRYKDVLEKWGSPFYYELVGLDPHQSFLLFCTHAFKENDSCSEDFGTLANDIARTTAGLPLAIEIIGSFLHGKEKYVWEDTLDVLKETPYRDVQRILKISFDALEPAEKEIFLDVACLPICKDRELAIYMWESCGFFRQQINSLISKSMIKYGEGNTILIHDQLRDLGRDIVRQESIDYIGNRSRIWKDEDAQQVFELKQGTRNVQALSFCNYSGDDEHCTSQQFEGMKLLRFLHMERVQLIGNFENLFLNLRWLRWNVSSQLNVSGCIDIVGINFKPKRLVVLQLDNCNVMEHWTGWNEMKYLKVLELWSCDKLNTTPDFSAMEELYVLILRSCDNLREIDSSIGKFSQSLKVLDVRACPKLKELPKEVGKMEELRRLDIGWTGVREIPIFEGYLTKLETLSADCCTELPKSIGKLVSLTKVDLYHSKVTKLPDSVGDLYNLQKLSLSSSTINCLPTFIGKLCKLQKLDLSSCIELAEIPESIGMLVFLIELDLTETRVTKLPDSIGDLYNLEKLRMDQSKIERLPTSIGKLRKLKKLDLSYCKELAEIPESIGMLELLIELDLTETRVTKLPDSIGDLHNLEKLSMYRSKIERLPTSIGKLHKLQKLSLRYCKELVEIPESIGMLSLLIELDLSPITKLPDSIGDLCNLEKLSMFGSRIECLPTSIGKLQKLQELNLWNCRELGEIPESIGKLKLLLKLDLCSTRVIKLPDSIGDLDNLEKLLLCNSMIECLPTSIGNLYKLQELDLYACRQLGEIPESMGQLQLLTELNLDSTRVTKLPDSIGDLYNLEKLIMFESKIQCLPTSIGKLYKLQKLDLCFCRELGEIPESIGKLKLLIKLDLRSTRVTTLPDSIGDLYNLEKLIMSESKIECLPTSIAMLTKLQKLDLEGCKELESLPNLPCSLAFISFNGDSMETLPDFSKLTNLNHLTYKDSFQRSRELNLGKLNQLVELNIHDSKLKIHKENYRRDFPLVYFFEEGINMAPENFWLLLELPSSVKRLEVIGCQTLYTLPNLSTLKNLSRLHLQKCSKLLEISGLGGAESLINVHISGCHPEIKIPDLSMLRNLKDLTINNERLMEILGLQELKSLEDLNISGCKSLKYLPDLSRLANLQFLDIRGCTELRMTLDLPQVQITSDTLESKEESESDCDTFEEQEESENDSKPHEDDA